MTTCKYSQAIESCHGDDCHACLTKRYQADLPNCGHVSDMGHGEVLCDLAPIGENKVCYLHRGLECGLDKIEKVRVEE